MRPPGVAALLLAAAAAATSAAASRSPPPNVRAVSRDDLERENKDATGSENVNNWAIILAASRYFYNYRHTANALSFYHTVRRMGVPDSRIILFLAEDHACNPRNRFPGAIFNAQWRVDPKEQHSDPGANLYACSVKGVGDKLGDTPRTSVEVDYRGEEVNLENFLRVLTGRHEPETPRNKRLLSDSQSNILIYATGHSGEEFIKFQDWEEMGAHDLADGIGQMWHQGRYRSVLWVTDTCQAATLQNQFFTPNVIGIGSSGPTENSYSHHLDGRLGVAMVDRFSLKSDEFFSRALPGGEATFGNGIQHAVGTKKRSGRRRNKGRRKRGADATQAVSSQKKKGSTIRDWLSSLSPHDLRSTPTMRSDLFNNFVVRGFSGGERRERVVRRDANQVELTEYFASAGRINFYYRGKRKRSGRRPAKTAPAPGAPGDALHLSQDVYAKDVSAVLKQLQVLRGRMWVTTGNDGLLGTLRGLCDFSGVTASVSRFFSPEWNAQVLPGSGEEWLRRTPLGGFLEFPQFVGSCGVVLMLVTVLLQLKFADGGSDDPGSGSKLKTE